MPNINPRLGGRAGGFYRYWTGSGAPQTSAVALGKICQAVVNGPISILHTIHNTSDFSSIRAASVPRFLCLKPGRVHFLRQADQVSDCQERAHANESRQGRVSHQLEKMRGQIKAAGRNIGSGPVASAK